MKRNINKEVKYRLGSLYDNKLHITKNYDTHKVTADGVELVTSNEKHTPSTQELIKGRGTCNQRMSVVMEAIDKSDKIDDVIMCYPGLDAIKTEQTDGYTFGHARNVVDTGMGLICDHWVIPKGVLMRARSEQSRSIPFTDKPSKAIFRGNKSGIGQAFHDKNKVRRDLFCDHFSKSKIIDAKIAKWQHDKTHVPRDVMSSDNRYLIHLEGNDTGSDIYWIFGNRNIVLMPQPHSWDTVWHLYLKPWKHFIPFEFKVDAETGKVETDIEDRISWCESNIDECEEIMNNANNLNDLMLDLDTEHKILEQMFIRYKQNIIL